MYKDYLEVNELSNYPLRNPSYRLRVALVVLIHALVLTCVPFAHAGEESPLPAYLPFIQPTLSGSILGQGTQSPGVIFLDLQVKNTSSVEARNVRINNLVFRVLSGRGSVTYNTTLSPLLPLVLGNLAAGASTQTRLYINAPSTVTRFSITESGTVQDSGGTTYSFSIAQSVINRINQPPAVNAGPNQTITLTAIASLQGTVSDDGRPTGATLTITWSTASGPGTVTFNPSNSANSTASFSMSGTYVLRLTANDSQFSSSSDVTITVLPVPQLLSISPNTGEQGQANLAVTITGQNTHFTNASLIDLGTGITVINVAATDDTHLAAELKIEGNAAVGVRNLSVTSGAELVSLAGAFTVNASGPIITDFSPKSASIGNLVTVTGSNLAPPAGTTAIVTLNKQSAGTIEAPVASSSATAILFLVPTSAATGPITVVVGAKSATSTANLTIVPSADFSLTGPQTDVNLIRGQSVGYVVNLNGDSGFNVLTPLTLTGLPAGVTASFKPGMITAGQLSVLTLTCPDTQPLTNTMLTVSASADLDGITVTKSVGFTLNVVPITTSFIGRTVVANTLQTPLAGVTVKFLGLNGSGLTTGCSGQTVSDAAGNFALTNLPSNCVGPQMIEYDGMTATSPPGKYAGVNLVYTLAPNLVIASPVLVHLPRVDDKETVMVRQNWPTDQIFDFTTIRNLSVTVYAGTTFTLPDGTRPDPFPLIVIEVPIDRLPDEMAPPLGAVPTFIVAFQPANTKASQPVAVTFPNQLNMPPGTRTQLTTLDPTRGTMVLYGTATISTNGALIIPDPDPARPGHRYGLVNFDWHGGFFIIPTYSSNPSPECLRFIPSGSSCMTCALIGDPIDLSSGLEVLTETDIAINGLRGGISIVRTYRSPAPPPPPVNFLPGCANCGGGGGVPGVPVDPPITIPLPSPFGTGGNHNYAFALDTQSPENATTINLIMPEGNRIPFTKSGTVFTNSTIPAFQGSVMTVGTGSADLRWKDGTTWRFTGLGGLFLISVLTSITDSNGNLITLVRDTVGQLVDVIDPVGRKLHLDYSNGHITQITDPIGRKVSYTYAGNNLIAVTNPNGNTVHYEYDDKNRLVRIFDLRGTLVAFNTYDANNRVKLQTRADGGIFWFAYELSEPFQGTSPVVKTIVTDPLGRQTAYRFTVDGFLTDVTDSLGQTRVFARDGSNRVTSVSGSGDCNVCGVPAAGSMSFSYDGKGNLTSRTDALGQTTSFSYDPVFNRVTAITDPLGKATRFTYDSTGNLLTGTDANSNKTTFGYSPTKSFGLIKSITDPLNKTTNLSYDDFANLTAITDPLGKTTAISYDGVSRPITTLDSLGQRSSIGYDNLDRVVRVTDPKNNNTNFGYDPVSNLLSVTDARGNTTGFTYDSMNRLLTRTTPLAKSDSRSYDLNDNLTKFVDRRGQTSTFGYDALNRLVKETYADGSTVARLYDSLGRLREVMDSTLQPPGISIPEAGAFRYTYDAAGRLTRTANRFGTVQYSYDSAGHVTSRQVVGQPAVDYSYDAVGNLKRSATTLAAVDYSYDARNQLLNIARFNGVASQYNYDALGRLLSLIHSRGSTVLHSQSYTYDTVGNRTSQATTNAQSLITQPATSQYDTGNRLLSRGATTYSYDDNGNLISETSPAGTTSYAWDSRNRLQSITAPGGQTIGFLYDFAGNLVQQKDSGPALNLTQTFVLDDLTNVAFQSKTTGEQFSILTGQSIDQHLALIRPSGAVEYGLTDAINSTLATVDQTGAIKGQFFYEVFGETTASGSSFPFQYTGRVPLSSPLYYYRTRIYNSSTGRFISEDPIGFAGGDVNFYRYVWNSPITFVDPLGLEGWVTERINQLNRQAIGEAEDGKLFEAFQTQFSSVVLQGFNLFTPLGSIDELTDPCKSWPQRLFRGALVPLGFGWLRQYQTAHRIYRGQGLSRDLYMRLVHQVVRFNRFWSNVFEYVVIPLGQVSSSNSRDR